MLRFAPPIGLLLLAGAFAAAVIDGRVRSPTRRSTVVDGDDAGRRLPGQIRADARLVVKNAPMLWDPVLFNVALRRPWSISPCSARSLSSIAGLALSRERAR